MQIIRQRLDRTSNNQELKFTRKIRTIGCSQIDKRATRCPCTRVMNWNKSMNMSIYGIIMWSITWYVMWRMEKWVKVHYSTVTAVWTLVHQYFRNLKTGHKTITGYKFSFILKLFHIWILPNARTYLCHVTKSYFFKKYISVVKTMDQWMKNDRMVKNESFSENL